MEKWGQENCSLNEGEISWGFGVLLVGFFFSELSKNVHAH